MKKVQILSALAFIIAIGTAATPKAIALVKKPTITVFVPTGSCTATKDCADSGSTLCGYRSSGCTDVVNKP